MLNTNGYKSLYDEAVDWTYWVYQIAKVFEHFPGMYSSKFTTNKIGNVQIVGTLSNVKVDKLENL